MNYFIQTKVEGNMRFVFKSSESSSVGRKFKFSKELSYSVGG